MKNPHALAREYGEDAVEVLNIEMRGSPRAQDRIRAAEAMLDRGYGKAAQGVVMIPGTREREKAAALYSDEELTRIIDAEFEVRATSGAASPTEASKQTLPSEASGSRMLPVMRDPLLE